MTMLFIKVHGENEKCVFYFDFKAQGNFFGQPTHWRLNRVVSPLWLLGPDSSSILDHSVILVPRHRNCDEEQFGGLSEASSELAAWPPMRAVGNKALIAPTNRSCRRAPPS